MWAGSDAWPWDSVRGLVSLEEMSTVRMHLREFRRVWRLGYGFTHKAPPRAQIGSASVGLRVSTLLPMKSDLG